MNGTLVIRYLSCLLGIVSYLLFATHANADDSDIVKLKSASSFYWAGAGQAGRAINIQVRVKNIAYTKNVYVHYNAGGAGWHDLELDFTSHHGNYDLFTYNTSFSDWTGSIEFAIRFETDGDIYWNNNDGANFSIDSGDDFIIENEVRLRQMDVDGYRCAGWMGCTHASHLTGDIYVRNLNYNKTVGVHCSSDGSNWEDIHAVYSGPMGGEVERWSFDTWDYAYQPGSAYPEYACAVFYDNYWDNNFSQDYQVQYEALEQLR